MAQEPVRDDDILRAQIFYQAWVSRIAKAPRNSASKPRSNARIPPVLLKQILHFDRGHAFED